MTKIIVTFFFSYGVTQKVEFEHESKHFGLDDFETTMSVYAQNIGAYQWISEVVG